MQKCSCHGTQGVSAKYRFPRDVWETATSCAEGEGQHYTKSAGYRTTCTAQDCRARFHTCFDHLDSPRLLLRPNMVLEVGIQQFRELHTLYICGTAIDHNLYRFFACFFRCGRISRLLQASVYFLVRARNCIACSDVYSALCEMESNLLHLPV